MADTLDGTVTTGEVTYQCYSTGDGTFYANVYSITNNALTTYTSLTIASSVTYNSTTYTVTKMATSSLFGNNKTIKDVTIPSTVTYMVYPFKSSHNIQNINVDSGNTTYCSVNGVLLNKAKTRLVAFPGGRTVCNKDDIPSTVTQIYANAFYDSDLFEIHIPDTVTSISVYSLAYCENLRHIELPSSITSIPTYCCGHNPILESVTIPDKVTTIDYNAFYGCTSMSKVILGAKVATINSYAFQECTNLKTVYNLSSLTITKGATTNGYVGYYADNIYTTAPSPISKLTDGDTPIQVDSAIRDGNGRRISSTYATNAYVSEVKDGLTDGSVTQIGTATVGSTAKPIYLVAGKPATISATVGGVATPVYLNAGTITKCSSTVGSGTKPVYMSAGTITPSASSVGSTTKPVYMSAGNITACSGTVGSGTQPTYMSAGTITASTSNVGGTSNPMYLKAGVMTACSDTVGSATQPVYLNAGTVTKTSCTLATSVPSGAVFTDTKNTAGSTNSTSKLFLVGATSQGANPQTYSNASVYATNGTLYATKYTGGTATTSASGLMSASDKVKLDGIETSAKTVTTKYSSGTNADTSSTYIYANGVIIGSLKIVWASGNGYRNATKMQCTVKYPFSFNNLFYGCGVSLVDQYDHDLWSYQIRIKKDTMQAIIYPDKGDGGTLNQDMQWSFIAIGF